MEYILKNKWLEVRFQSLGGSLSSIKDKDGVEYLWQGDKRYWGGQAPVLFPICGSIRGDKAITRDGNVLEMPRHGIVRKREFCCVNQEDQTICFAIDSETEMLCQYPYLFRLEIEYTLWKNEIKTEYRIFNKGEQDMPFWIGGHPGFNCPLFEAESYEDYRLEFSQKETCDVPEPVTETGLINITHRTPFLRNQKELDLSHQLFEKDAVILDELKSRTVKLLSKNHEKSIQLDFADFPYLILWSSTNGGPFIAIEPWLGLSTCNDEGDVFEEKRNVQIANPGECKQYSFRIKIG